MATAAREEEMGERLFMASSYLRVPEDNQVLDRGNLHPYCQPVPDYDQSKVEEKPSLLKKIFNTLF